MATSHLAILTLLSLSLSYLSHAAERCQPNDKKALLQIKKDLKNPYILISWNPKLDCCDWEVVECDDQTNRINTFTLFDADLKLPIPASIGDLPYLLYLNIISANFTGEIPEAIAKLSHLRYLHVRENLLTGPVPSFLSQLKKLSYIGLSFNSLTGSIPASLSQLSQLRALDLRGNLLTGRVPSFLSQLKKLSLIELSFNSLTGSIPASLFQLPELTGLFLDRNNLTGGIPASFGYKKQQEFYLYLSHNQLSGPIPATLGYTNFSSFDVSRNRLEGDISFMFGKNKSLNTADFSWNLFQFDFSKVDDQFPENLQNLDLNHNKIFGSLPASLAKIKLTSMNVSYNRLCGRIPVGGRLQELDYTAYFHNRCLCGKPLPNCK